MAGHDRPGGGAALSGDIALRRAVAVDAPAVRDLTRRTYVKWVPIIGREPLPMTADYDVAVRDHRVDLVTVDGALAGLIETVPLSDHLLIENVAIAPEWQGHGLGRRLLAHAETVAASLGLTELRLYTNARMTANISLYGGLGYAVVREERKAEDWTIIHMAKHLRP